MKFSVFIYLVIPATIAVIVNTMLYAIDDSKDLRNDLKVESSGYIFNSIKECEGSEKSIDVPCDIAFKVAEKKAGLIAKSIPGLVDCKKYFDRNCEMNSSGYYEPKMAGIFYLNTDTPSISPIFVSPTSGHYQLASSCIIKKTDRNYSFNHVHMNVFKFLNYQDPNHVIYVPSGKTNSRYALRDYIDRKQNKSLDRRMTACMRYTK